VQHNRARGLGDNHDVVERSGPILDERQHGPAEAKLAGQEGGSADDGRGVPASAGELGDEAGGADPGGAAIHQVGERLGVDPALAPVAQHHGRRRAPAERFGLGDERHVEDGERLRGRLGTGGRRPPGPGQDNRDDRSAKTTKTISHDDHEKIGHEEREDGWLTVFVPFVAARRLSRARR
jgi:hypothetical protein